VPRFVKISLVIIDKGPPKVKAVRRAGTTVGACSFGELYLCSESSSSIALIPFTYIMQILHWSQSILVSPFGESTASLVRATKMLWKFRNVPEP
jgi:hypothetical protein